MPTILKKNVVSAVQARQQFGELLDKAYYRSQSFVVERSGQPRAAIVPMRQYVEMQRIKQSAKERFFELVDKARARNKGVDPNIIQKEIDEAVEEVRKEYSNP